jgi:hypothetical protein
MVFFKKKKNIEKKISTAKKKITTSPVKKTTKIIRKKATPSNNKILTAEGWQRRQKI